MKHPISTSRSHVVRSILRRACHISARLCLVLLLGAASLAQGAPPASGAIAVDAYDNLAATADLSGAVKLFDATNAGRPALLATVTVPRTLTGLAFAGKYLLVSGQSGVQILDIANPKSPVFANTVTLEPEAKAVKAAGNLGYTAVGSALVLFDIPTGEILDQHEYSNLAIDDLALSGDYLYVVSAEPDATTGFQIFKVQVQDHLAGPLASWTSDQHSER